MGRRKWKRGEKKAEQREVQLSGEENRAILKQKLTTSLHLLNFSGGSFTHHLWHSRGEMLKQESIALKWQKGGDGENKTLVISLCFRI